MKMVKVCHRNNQNNLSLKLWRSNVERILDSVSFFSLRVLPITRYYMLTVHSRIPSRSTTQHLSNPTICHPLSRTFTIPTRTSFPSIKQDHITKTSNSSQGHRHARRTRNQSSSSHHAHQNQSRQTRIPTRCRSEPLGDEETSRSSGTRITYSSCAKGFGKRWTTWWSGVWAPCSRVTGRGE